MYQIEKHVPLPEQKRNTKELSPFTKTAMALEVGESFFCGHLGSCATAHAYLQTITRKFPSRKFATRKVEGGVRIWRVA